ncbi:MAG: hypothetical protein P8N02_12290 [Actinomycetota bacterium]|jgi:hypothetical protein|nr:hypothetical protein [Actinomycetota bacterium]
MIGRATPEMMAAAERSFARALDRLVLNGLAAPNSDRLVRMMYTVSEGAEWFRHNPVRAELLAAWCAHGKLGVDGYAEMIAGSLETTRNDEVARFAVTPSELYASMVGAGLALHGHWRQFGHPEGHIESHLLTVMNLLRIPHDAATAALVEVLALRALNS